MILEDLISKKFTLERSGKYLRAVEHNSLVVDPEKQTWYWNSKSLVGDAYTWLREIEHKSHDEAKRILTNYHGFEQVYVTTIKHGEESVVYPKLVSIFFENGKDNRDYWYSRGYTDNTIDKFQLGYYEGWYSIPFFVDGTFRNFQVRRNEPTKLIKRWYKGLPPLLFNSDILKFTSTIIIAESPPDAILLSQYGIPAVSQDNGAGYWSTDWFRYFIEQKDIYLLYDNDEAGRKGAKKVADSLGIYRTKIYTFQNYPDKYDLGDWLTDPMNKPEELMSLIESEAKRSFEL